MVQSNAIQIDLDLVGNPNISPDSPSAIQRAARSRVLEILTRPVRIPQDDTDEGNRPPSLDVQSERRHDAILVSARRGEGKTTFLAAILATIQTGNSSGTGRAKDAGFQQPANLFSLGLIDPTLIETKQNIIIVVIDRIRIATEHRRRRSGNFDAHAPVEHALRKLAQGLSLLDGIGDGLYAGKDWLDPDFVLDRGLEEASAAHDFERRFRAFVKAAAHYLGVEAFVLAIDDVDTWFERGWPVLEALRKYLVTPQLRIILSGDLNLYALLVRRQQWAQMGNAFLQAEDMRGKADEGRSMIGKIGSMVEALQDQYLIKVAPPENRVDLQSLAYHADHQPIEVAAAALGGAVDLKTFLRTMCERMFATHSDADFDLIARQILQMPTRSVLQLLAGAVPICAREQPAPGARHNAEDALRHVAWTALMSVDIEIEKTRAPAPEAILGLLGEWLTRARLWPQLAKFFPSGVDADGYNLVALYLSAVLTGVFETSPSLMIDFWLRIATIREKIDRSELGPSNNNVKALFEHLTAGTMENSLQFVSRLAAWEVTEGSRRENMRRTISQIRLSGASVPLGRIRERNAALRQLYGLDYSGKSQLDRGFFMRASIGPEIEKERLLAALPVPLRGYHRALFQAGWSYASRRGTEAGFQVYFANGIEDLADRLDRNAGIVARIPMHRIVSGQSFESGNYSFLRLLSVVGELIDLVAQDPNGRMSAINRILRAATQTRSYPTPFAAQGVRPDEGQDYDDDDDDFDDRELDSGGEGEEGRIEDLLALWLAEHSAAQTVAPLAPILLSRMWTRFTYSFHTMRDDLVPGGSRYLGVLLHRSLIAFLHAVGYEAMRAANVETSRSVANNPTKSGANFVRLLREIYEDQTKASFRNTPEFAFFDMLFSCPLWAYFLARHEEQEVEKVRSEEPNDSIWQAYCDRILPYWPDEDASFAGVELSSPRNESPARFDGLFLLLNSVQLQGAPEQVRDFGKPLLDAQSGVPRRRRRRIGLDDELGDSKV